MHEKITLIVMLLVLNMTNRNWCILGMIQHGQDNEIVVLPTCVNQT